MDGEIKVFLPEHATSTTIFHVMSKFIGTYNSRERKQKKVDVNMPSTIGNEWTISFIHPYNSRVDYRDETFERIQVCDILDVAHIFDFHKSGVVNGYTLNNERLLISQSTAVAGLISKQLVDFFGGKMIVSNSHGVEADTNGINYTYECNIPLYPPLKKGKSAKKHRLQFENELHALNTITSQELIEMHGKTSWTFKDNLLFNNLNPKFAKSYVQMADLTKSLSQSTENSPIKRMKI